MSPLSSVHPARMRPARMPLDESHLTTATSAAEPFRLLEDVILEILRALCVDPQIPGPVDDGVEV
jgi:hypothetical protein